MPSKHQGVQMSQEGQPDAGLTKDFINSSLHRFKKPAAKIIRISTFVHSSPVEYSVRLPRQTMCALQNDLD